jgi:HEPN domain-containing protein
VKNTGGWLRQAKYDFETAGSLFESKRYIYAVFFCHLAVEKAIKAVWQHKHKALPPKSHNLTWLLGESGFALPDDLAEFFHGLAQASVPVLYPETLEGFRKAFPRTDVVEILKSTKETIRCIAGFLKTK